MNELKSVKVDEDLCNLTEVQLFGFIQAKFGVKYGSGLTKSEIINRIPYTEKIYKWTQQELIDYIHREYGIIYTKKEERTTLINVLTNLELERNLSNLKKEELLPLITPGEILKEDFLDEFKISSHELSRELFVSHYRIKSIIEGTREIDADTALRLEKYFGVSAEFWLNLQKDYDLRLAKRNEALDMERIIPFKRNT